MMFAQIELLVNRDPQTGYRPVKIHKGRTLTERGKNELAIRL